MRLDAVARFLQDAAIDDVQETGWGAPEHLWVVRRIRVDVLAPLLRDRELEITTWCSGVAAIAAGRRWSVAGDESGRIEVDSVWIHLGPTSAPAGSGTSGRTPRRRRAGRSRRSCSCPTRPRTRLAAPWALRSTDLDAHGHVNNAVYWQAVEDVLTRDGGIVETTAAGRARLPRPDRPRRPRPSRAVQGRRRAAVPRLRCRQQGQGRGGGRSSRRLIGRSSGGTRRRLVSRRRRGRRQAGSGR